MLARFKDKFTRLSKKGSNTKHFAYVGHDYIYLKNIYSDKEPEEFQFALSEKSVNEVFENISKIYPPKGNEISLVLGSHWYQILHTEKPKVQPSEVKEAILWAVKDMVSTPVSELQMDYFEAPISTQSKVSIVVTDNNGLSSLVTNLYDLGFHVVSISIEEMAVANIPYPKNEAVLVISKYENQDLLIQIIKNGFIFVERRVKGFKNVENLDYDNLPYDLPVKLSDEISRSLAFFEGQLRQEPVSSIHILIAGENKERFKQLISSNHLVTVELIECESIGRIFASLAESTCTFEFFDTKARINLLNDNFIPKKIKVGLKQYLIGTFSTFGIAVSLSGLAIYFNSNQSIELGIKQVNLATISEQKSILERQIQEKKVDPKLIEKVSLAENRIKTMEGLLGKLSNKNSSKNIGFSILLTDLAAVDSKNIWLEKIYISDEKMFFQGVAIKGADIPKWINSLKTTQYLSGRKFKTITMAQEQNKPVRFLLASMPDAGIRL